MLLKRIISFMVLSLSISTLLSPALIPYSVFADDVPYNSICNDSTVPLEVRKASGCPGSSDEGTLPQAVVIIINGVIAVAGVISVIYVIIGGVHYITSTGDPNKVEKAKKTILYAVIGLAICVLAFAIVNFTINNVINYTPSAPEAPSPSSGPTPQPV